MATKRTTTPPPPPAAPARPPYMLIEEIRVQGYKSLVDATLHVRPLTLLAGTNSSGKSSIMQPLLLIKQTMEAPYQPAGALVLDGAHVQAETAGELVSKITRSKKFSIVVAGQDKAIKYKESLAYNSLEIVYEINNSNFIILYQKSSYGSGDEIILESVKHAKGDVSRVISLFNQRDVSDKIHDGEIIQDGPFLTLGLRNPHKEWVGAYAPSVPLFPVLTSIMHVPGLRRKPERSYPATHSQEAVRGTFDLYAAGIISQWQQQNNAEALAQLNDYLVRLGLTNSVTAKVKNANEVELSVNRLPSTSKAKPRKADMVNIADVGIGVSQVLPILVALIAAQEGQIVYVEQPELHLHPRAQVAMGELLAEAANRGVRVIVETHSSLLLLTVQTLIAQGKIVNTDVGLHWFTRDAKGASQVQYVVPDEDGAYGAWPEDFSEIELKAQDAYLTAVGLRQFGEAAQ